MKASRGIQAIIWIATNCLIIYIYGIVLYQPIRIVEAIILMAIGSLITVCLLSIIRGPKQFFQALFERVVRPFALLSIILIRIVGLFISTFLRSIRLILGLAVAAIYGVWPIDLIPDVLVGPGQLDDIVVTLLSVSWGLFFGRVVISSSIKKTARDINYATQIRTQFP